MIDLYNLDHGDDLSFETVTNPEALVAWIACMHPGVSESSFKYEENLQLLNRIEEEKSLIGKEIGLLLDVLRRELAEERMIIDSSVFKSIQYLISLKKVKGLESNILEIENYLQKANVQMDNLDYSESSSEVLSTSDSSTSEDELE